MKYIDPNGEKFSLGGLNRVLGKISKVTNAIVDVGTAVVPIVNDFRDVVEVTTGTNIITGTQLTQEQKDLTAFGAMMVGSMSGAEFRAADNFINAARVRNIAQKYNWGRSEALEDHFIRHGADFGNKTMEEYASEAQSFYQRGLSDSKSGIEVITSGVDGKIRMYDQSTSTFGVYGKNGSTSTFFKPKDGDNYWQDQKIKHQ